MKVVFDNQALVMQEYGGVSRYCIELARQWSLEDSGVDISWYPSIRILRREEAGVNHLPRIAIRNFRGIYKISNIFAQAFSVIPKADVFHSTYYFPVSVKRCRFRGMMLHDLIEEELSEHNPESYRIRLDRKMRSVELCDILFFNSKTTMGQFAHYYPSFRGEKVVSYLGTNFNLQFSREFASERFFLYVGKRKGYKDFDLLVRLFREYPEISKEFKLVAFGGEIPSASERSLHSNYGIKYVTGDDNVLKNLYSRAKLLLFPSHREGFGLPLIEALSHNLPVVCADTPIFREIGREFAMYFKPGDIDSLRACITSLWSEEFSGPFATEQHQYLALDRYSWRNVAARTLGGYSGLLNRV